MLPEQLGPHCYAVSTHPDELVLEPSPIKNPGSAYEHRIVYIFELSGKATRGTPNTPTPLNIKLFQLLVTESPCTKANRTATNQKPLLLK